MTNPTLLRLLFSYFSYISCTVASCTNPTGYRAVTNENDIGGNGNPPTPDEPLDPQRANQNQTPEKQPLKWGKTSRAVGFVIAGATAAIVSWYVNDYLGRARLNSEIIDVQIIRPEEGRFSAISLAGISMFFTDDIEAKIDTEFLSIAELFQTLLSPPTLSNDDPDLSGGIAAARAITGMEEILKKKIKLPLKDAHEAINRADAQLDNINRSLSKLQYFITAQLSSENHLTSDKTCEDHYRRLTNEFEGIDAYTPIEPGTRLNNLPVTTLIPPDLFGPKSWCDYIQNTVSSLEDAQNVLRDAIDIINHEYQEYNTLADKNETIEVVVFIANDGETPASIMPFATLRLTTGKNENNYEFQLKSSNDNKIVDAKSHGILTFSLNNNMSALGKVPKLKEQIENYATISQMIMITSSHNLFATIPVPAQVSENRSENIYKMTASWEPFLERVFPDEMWK